MVKYSIIMPAYNEEKTIAEVINKVKDVFKDEDYELIIIDDGSKDKTQEIVKDLISKDSRIRLISYGENKGKGYAVRTGIKEARGEFLGIQDADMEYDPAELMKLFQVSEITGFVVYGSRILGNIKNMKWYIKAGNQFLSWIFSLLYGQRITDVETCYKVGKVAWFKALNLNSNNFDIEIELTAKLLKQGHFILEVPINYKARSKSEKKLKPFKDGFHALYKIVYYRFFE